MASNTELIATIQTSIRGNERNSVENIMSIVEKYRQSVESLREENHEKERMRDQYIIHLQQCQEDHEILRNIYKKLRLHLDREMMKMDPKQGYPGINPNIFGANAYNQRNTQQEGFGQEQSANYEMRRPSSESRNPQIQHITIEPLLTSKKLKFNLKFTLKVDGIVCSVAYNHDCSKFAFSNGFFLYIINAIDGKELDVVELASSSKQATCRSIAFAPDSSVVAFLGSTEEIFIYDLEKHKLYPPMLGHSKEVSSLLFSHDGKYIISGSIDGSICLWRKSTRELKKQIPYDGSSQELSIVSMSAAQSSDQGFIAVAFSNGTVGIHSPTFEDPMMTFPTSKDLVAITVSPSDDSVATMARDGSIVMWKIQMVSKKTKTLEGHTDIVLCAKFSYNNPLLFTGSKDKTIRVWSLEFGDCIALIGAHQNSVFGIDHHKKENRFISCGGDGTICAWEYQYL